jgi:hypothetical protein
MTGIQSTQAVEARKQLAILGLAFRLDELELSEGIYAEITRTAKALTMHVSYVEPTPKGCAVYIDEIAWSPDLGGRIHGHQKVERPYWFPKLLVGDLRDLENDLNHLALLQLAVEAGWGPDLRFRGGKI